MNAIRIAVLLICGSLVAGCAFGERQARLGYPPVAGDGTMASAQAAPVVSSGRGIVKIGTFQDIRSQKKVVGHVRNGFGMKTAEVVPQRDVTEWVREALAYELKAAGYNVVEVASSMDAPTISGAIVRVYCDAYFTYDGEVTLSIETEKAGQRLAKNAYTGSGSAGMNWGATGDSYSESLSLALQMALRQFIAEFDLLEK